LNASDSSGQDDASEKRGSDATVFVERQPHRANASRGQGLPPLREQRAFAIAGLCLEEDQAQMQPLFKRRCEGWTLDQMYMLWWGAEAGIAKSRH
jgi:hypothetical protein